MKNRIKNLVFTPIAILIIAEEIQAEIEYEQMIAESQAKIGPYVHNPGVVQIYG